MPSDKPKMLTKLNTLFLNKKRRVVFKKFVNIICNTGCVKSSKLDAKEQLIDIHMPRS